MQGSVGTCVNYGRIFIDSSTANLLQSVTVKEFWKSVSISQSYRQNKVALFSGYGVVFSLVLTLGSILPRVKNNNNTGNVNNNT